MNHHQNNWYAKLHPIGTAQQATEPKTLLNLSIFFRIWLAVALVLIICGVVIFSQLFGYIKPTAQQVIEDTLLDTSQLLAASLQAPLASGQLYDDAYQATLDAALVNAPKRGTAPEANNQTYQPQNIQRRSVRVYVTDHTGTIIYDSRPRPNNAEGQDYSRWNDVYLTLKGQYGARSTTHNDPQHDTTTNTTTNTTIMYVAQPIHDAAGSLIGVVSVGKPVASVSPYLDDTRSRMLITALLISIAALILAGLVAWWLKQSISLVTQYTSALAEDTKKPYFYLGRELNSLTDSIELMKHRLENRAYVTDYVHTLTHELKSPLTAIRASGELLEDENLDLDDRQMLSQAIGEQSIKMQQLIDRLLLLAKVEQPTFKLNRQPLSVLPLLQSLITDNTAKLQQQHLSPIDIYFGDKRLTDSTHLSPQIVANSSVYADRFWLIQVLQNVLDNAIHFADSQVVIYLRNTAPHSSAQTVTIDIFNDGKLLPDYAVHKVFDRYFSLSHQSQPAHQATNSTTSYARDTSSENQKTELSHPDTDSTSNILKKGTGLGLTLVKQVIEHHGGQVTMNNVHANNNKNGTDKTGTDKIGTDKHQRAGVMVSITLPLAKV